MKYFFCCFFLLIVTSYTAHSYDSIEIFSGYLKAPLEEKDDYKGVPVLVSFNYDTGSLIERKFDINFPGDLTCSVEPFFTTIYSPDTNFDSFFLINTF